MRRLSSGRFRSIAAALAAALVLIPSATQAQAPPSLEREPTIAPADPTWDGAVKGALVGAGAMAGLLTINYARCDAGCEAPAEGPMFAWGMSVGAGGGAAVGWLIDKLHKGRGPAPVAVSFRTDRQERSVRVTMPVGTPRLRLASLRSSSLVAQAAPASRPAEPALVDDSLMNGALIGAGVGAGVGFLTVGAAYAICADSNCGPSSDGAWAIGTAAGAGIGLVTGLLIDKARRDPAPPVAVVVRADRQEKAVRVQWRF
jgi:hypothetical protein